MRARDVAGHRRQALEVAPLVLKQPLGGDCHPVFALAPFAQQDRARREIELPRLGPQLDLGVFCADGFQALLGLGRKATEGFLLQLVGDTGLDVRAVGVVRAARELPIPDRPEFGHRQAGQLRDPCRDGCLFLVHHNFST